MPSKSEKPSPAVHKTIKVPATHVHQNHLDLIRDTISTFCKRNGQYHWSLVHPDNGKHITGDEAVNAYLSKTRPKTLALLITTEDKSQELMIAVDNGIAINLRNGSYELFGLYSLLLDNLSTIKVHTAVVALRRYWLFNCYFAVWLIPAITLVLFHKGGWALFWIIILPIILMMLFMSTISTKENERSWFDDLEWNDVILSTKINYGKYSNSLGSPAVSLLQSFKTAISLVTSVATVISFVLLIVQWVK